MTDRAAADRIEALHHAPGPAVDRFDDASRLQGRVAVLPSAFNPPTLAHLELLRRAIDHGTHGTPAALLTTRNVDKGLYGALLHHRVCMLLALREQVPGLVVLVSNTARIMDQAQALAGAHPEASFDFVVGFDTLIRLFDERYYADIRAELPAFFAAHRVLAANRGAAGREAIEEFLALPFIRDFADRVAILAIDAEPASLSSTVEREAIARGEHPVGLPTSVTDYILRHGLYRPVN
jgi:nicotinic acid mononucleotide adenylyltransferase